MLAIHFAPERWDGIRDKYRRWWAGDLKRPLINLTLHDRDPGRPEPPLPRREFTSYYDFSVAPEDIVDRWDYDLSRVEFLGDSFPVVRPNFGPGIVAGFLGARVTPAESTTWFDVREPREISQMHFEYDASNVWLRRIKDICRAAVKRWKGQVQIAMTDLGGAIDVLSSFLPGEALLLDLYDHPREVKRVTWEIHDLWWRYYDEINAVLRDGNPGYTSGAAIFSEKPYYMLQCDFCYMIGPAMFDEFVKPELADSCQRIPHAFYHLDGAGQLPHLDSLLAIPELKGVQWIPGAGAKPQSQWPDVYRRIRKAGKLIQVFASSSDNCLPLDFHWLDTLVDQLGSQEGVIMLGATAPMERRDEALDFLAKYGAA